MNTKDHYQNHLSKFYSWMYGDYSEMVEKQKQFFEQNGISPRASKVAIDLGSGSGFQSIALKQMGFDVYAVDFSLELLQELQGKDDSVKIRHGDITDLSFADGLNPYLIVCMGDTLTHLESKAEVTNLIKKSYSLLKSNGIIVLTFRNLGYVRNELDRFIPVKSDANRILTCFLEDEGDKVVVYDLLHERVGDHWNLEKSFYRKLKIDPSWLSFEMKTLGFEVKASQLASGMEVIIGMKR